MTQQVPPPPSIPPAAGQSQLSAQDRADIAQGIRDAQATARDAQQIAAQASRGPGSAVTPGVLKEPSGVIMVTGPDGKQIMIDPKAGLDGDQIQDLVQKTLQPAQPNREDTGPTHGAVQIVLIVFLSLLAAIFMITRAMRRRPLPAGSSTAVLPPETVARLARIEQAVEAVAIEVERISEGQRYSAQLLTDRLAVPVPALGARTVEAPGLGTEAARG